MTEEQGVGDEAQRGVASRAQSLGECLDSLGQAGVRVAPAQTREAAPRLAGEGQGTLGSLSFEARRQAGEKGTRREGGLMVGGLGAGEDRAARRDALDVRCWDSAPVDRQEVATQGVGHDDDDAFGRMGTRRRHRLAGLRIRAIVAPRATSELNGGYREQQRGLTAAGRHEGR